MKRPKLSSIERWLAQVAGGRKGGRARVQRGVGHQWTADEARAIALKYWARRRKKVNSRHTMTCGRRTIRSKFVAHQPLREQYSVYPPTNKQNIWCEGAVATGWGELLPEGYTRRLQERTALVRLGYLRKSKTHKQRRLSRVHRQAKSLQTRKDK